MSQKQSDNKNAFGIPASKKQGVKFPSKKIKAKDLGNISFDLSKEEEIMRKSPGLMENSMIENITTMNSIFEQKQSERLMLNNINKISNNNNSMNSSLGHLGSTTFNDTIGNSALQDQTTNSDNPLDQAVIIKDSSEIKKEEKEKKSSNKKMTYVLISLVLIIIFLILVLVLLYINN